MDKIASYKIIPTLKLILEYYSGDLNWYDIQELKKKEYADTGYNNQYDLLGDIRDSVVHFNSNNEFVEFVQYVKDAKVALSKKRIAILTDSPNNVVNSTLIIEFSKELPMSFKIFSTIESLVEWIGMDKNYVILLDEYLVEHRNNPDNIFDLKKAHKV